VVTVDQLSGHVSAYVRGSGQARWTADPGASLDTNAVNGRAPAAVVGTTVVLPLRTTRTANRPDALVALDVATGKERWRGPMVEFPVEDGGVLVGGGEQGPATALDAATGAQLWQQPGAPSYSQIWAVGDGFVGVHVLGGALAAYDLRSGTRRWQQPNERHTWLLVAEGDAAYASSDVEISALAGADGATRWTQWLPVVAPAWGDAIVADADRVVVSISDFPPGD
jgi:outer membrane protein assembly factor BamB